MSKIALPTKDIVALSSDEANNILYEWISRIPIEQESPFSVYCPDKLRNYLEVRGIYYKTHRVWDITDLIGGDLSREIFKGLCFVLEYSIEFVLVEDDWFNLRLSYYGDNRVMVEYQSDLSKVDISEEEIIQEFKKYGFFNGNEAMTWAEAHGKIALLNKEGIPPVLFDFMVPQTQFSMTPWERKYNKLHKFISQFPLSETGPLQIRTYQELCTYLNKKYWTPGTMNSQEYDDCFLEYCAEGKIFSIVFTAAKDTVEPSNLYVDYIFEFYTGDRVATSLCNNMNQKSGTVKLLEKYREIGFTEGEMTWKQAYILIKKMWENYIPNI